MKKYITGTFAILTLFFMVSCKKSRNERVEEINSYEKQLFDAHTPLNYMQADSLICLFTEFAQDFPADTLSPVFLFKAADAAMNVGEFQNSINLYDEIILQYPNFSHIPESSYLKGFVYEQMNDLAKAKQAYTAFIEKYPDHLLAPDAQNSIDYLGISPEELVRKFEKKNGDSIQISQK